MRESFSCCFIMFWDWRFSLFSEPQQTAPPLAWSRVTPHQPHKATLLVAWQSGAPISLSYMQLVFLWCMCKWSTSAWGDLLVANFCRPMNSKDDDIHVLALVMGWAFSRHSESRLSFVPGKHFIYTKGSALCSFSKYGSPRISFCLNKNSLVHSIQGSLM